MFVTEVYDLSSHKLSNLTKLGSVRKSAFELMDIGIDCLEKFGAFNGITNNCQNYCNMVAKELGVSTQWTDVATVGVGSALLVGVAGAVVAGVMYGRKRNSNS